MGFSTDTKGRAFVATVQIKNMASMGMSEEEYKNPEYLANFLTSLWEDSGKGRSCAVAVCMSADGLYHAHMALYGNTTTLFLNGMENIQNAQGKRSDLEDIEEMLLKGMTPQEILDKSFRYYKYEKMILHAYISQRIQESPVKQDVYCEYHVGESASGKTYTYFQLCEKHGADSIYLLTDYDNNASGGLDSYMKNGAPPILFMDEFKGFGITYGKLLTMLNGYTRMQTHSRYANTFNLWDTVYITSVYPPENIYKIMVAHEFQDVDSYTQLLRRINRIVFHYTENGQYKTYAIDSREYKGYEDLRERAVGGFAKLADAELPNLPFKER